MTDDTAAAKTLADSAMPTTDVFALFGTDKNREKNGIWLRYGTSRVLVAHASPANKVFEARMSAALRPHRRAIDAGRITDEEFRKAVLPVYADLIILDWEGVPLEPGGAPVPYTRDNCIKVMTMLPNWLDDVIKVAGDYAAFQAVGGTSEDDVKN